MSRVNPLACLAMVSGLADLPAAAPLMAMTPPQMSSNTAPILALVIAEILSLMTFVGVCEIRAKDVILCESRWALALPAIALVGQSAATYFMDSGRTGTRGPRTQGPGGQGPGPGGGIPAAVVHTSSKVSRVNQVDAPLNNLVVGHQPLLQPRQLVNHRLRRWNQLSKTDTKQPCSSRCGGPWGCASAIGSVTPSASTA